MHDLGQEPGEPADQGRDGHHRAGPDHPAGAGGLHPGDVVDRLLGWCVGSGHDRSVPTCSAAGVRFSGAGPPVPGSGLSGPGPVGGGMTSRRAGRPGIVGRSVAGQPRSGVRFATESLHDPQRHHQHQHTAGDEDDDHRQRPVCGGLDRQLHRLAPGGAVGPDQFGARPGTARTGRPRRDPHLLRTAGGDDLQLGVGDGQADPLAAGDLHPHRNVVREVVLHRQHQRRRGRGQGVGVAGRRDLHPATDSRGGGFDGGQVRLADGWRQCGTPSSRRRPGRRSSGSSTSCGVGGLRGAAE